MSKFQFYCKPGTNRKEFTYIDTSATTFTQEKEQLLAQGFEVEDDFIYAATPQEATEKFKSNYVYALEEYAAAHPSSGIFFLISGLVRKAIKSTKTR